MNPNIAKWFSWRRKRFWAVVLFLCYVLGGFFVAPWVFTKQMEATFSDAGRTATIGKMSVNPFLLTIRAEDVEIIDTDDTLILAYDDYFWDFQASSLFRWAWTFKLISVDGLYLNEERFSAIDTRYTRLIEALTATEEPPPAVEEEDSGLPRIVIFDLAVRQARFQITDHLAGNYRTEFGPIDVSVQNLSTLPEKDGLHEVSIETASGGRIAWRGDLGFQPFRSSGRIEISGRGFAEAYRYIDFYLPFALESDQSGLTFDYRVNLLEQGLTASLENLQMNIGSTVVRKDSGEEWIRLDGVQLDGGDLRWPEQTIGLGTLTVSGLSIDAEMDATGELNLMSLLPAEDPGPADASDAATPWQVGLDALVLQDGTVQFTDRALEPAFVAELNGIGVTLRDIDNQPGTSMPVETAMTLASGGDISLSGNTTLLPDLTLDASVDIDALALALAQPQVSQLARVEIESGALSAQGQVQYGPDQPGAFRGAVGIDDMRIVDLVRGGDLAGWSRLELDQVEADLAANTVATSVLEFTGLFGALHIAEDRSTNIAGVLIESGESSGESAPAPDILVGGVRLEDASVDFSDYSLPLPFEAAIRNLDGEVSALSSTSTEPSRVDMEGQVNEYGLARVNGELNAWDVTQQADVAVLFENLDMSRLTPYTVQFAGYAIEGGRMDLDLQYLLQDRMLQGENAIVIRELQLGDKVEHPEAGSLPLGLAVALMTDANGVIDIDLPVAGDLDDPEFKIGGLVWRALGNLIAKAVTAPFRLLGALVGIDSEDFGQMQFQPGRADVSPPDREDLVKLGEAMAQRPELALEVTGVYEPVGDRAALQVDRVDAAIEARVEENSGGDALPTELRRAALESMVADKLPATDLAAVQASHTTPATEETEAAFDELAYQETLYQSLIDAEVVSDTELEGLATQRAEAVAAALREAHPDAPVQVTTEVTAIEPADDGRIVLELNVSADGPTAAPESD